MEFSKINLSRPQKLCKNIAIVDGFSGTGKSLILPILSHLENSELWQISEESESLCILEYLKKLDYNSAKTLVRKNFDKSIYNLNIGRGINLKQSDDSSAQNTLMYSKYKQRMQESIERKPIVDLIDKNRSLLVMDVHFMFGSSSIYFDIMDEINGVYIFMLRNPAHLVSALLAQDLFGRMGVDPMYIGNCINIDKKIFPYFVSEYLEEYLQCKNDIERVILIIHNFIKKAYDMHKILSDAQKKKFIFIGFETFTTNPDYYIDNICRILDKKKSESFDEIMSHLDMPRKYEDADYHKVEKVDKKTNTKISKKYINILENLIENHKSFLEEEQIKIDLYNNKKKV